MTEHESHGDAKVMFGFWIYLMTDLLTFSVLFATYAVLHNNTFGGPSGRELFDMPSALAETIILLTSSFTCGLGILGVHQKSKKLVLVWFGITLVLALAFLGLELSEFGKLIAEGNNWQRSAFLSSFFTLIGTHGLHITIGSIWMIVTLSRVWSLGITTSLARKLTLLSLFWHFLDIVWIFIFTIVYLMGAI